MEENISKENDIETEAEEDMVRKKRRKIKAPRRSGRVSKTRIKRAVRKSKRRRR
ncbi:MAG: hypothetical protein KAJ44_04155 [Thermoplasmatales archaeon]|nr:hypothetical protein [Thermoplasmatales archaeon]